MSVTDNLPDGVDFDSDSSSPECFEASEVVNCDIGGVPSNSSVDVTIAVTVPVTITRTLINTAVVSGNEDDPDTANNEITLETDIERPALEIVNDMLALTNLVPSYDPFDGRAPAGVFTITATWENVSDASIFDMRAEIVILTGENRVLNADDGAGVVGSIVSVPDGALGNDGVLRPGEAFTQVYELGLAARRQPFSFFVDVIVRDP